MYPRISVNLGNLLLSFSETLDLASTDLALHQMRTAFMAWELAKHANLSESRQERVFLAGLLHDIGALSLEEKIALHEGYEGDTEEHCQRGAVLFASNSWLATCAPIVLNHHRDFCDWPGEADAEVLFDSQILNLADFVERQMRRDVYILHQDEEIRRRLTELNDKQLCKEVVALFCELSQREEFWLDAASPRLYSLLLRNGPFRRIEIDLESIGSFAELASRIVDFKSPYTATHSAGVAQCASVLAHLAGLSSIEVKMMEVAGLLHDLGKLVVPNVILEKPAALTREEFSVIRQHAYYTFSVLSSIQGLQQIAEWAAFHHERLDGQGYPFKRKADELSLGARIMAVADIFTALTEDRPYRKGMEPMRIREIMEDQTKRAFIEARIVRILLDNDGDVRRALLDRQGQAREQYVRTLART
jgi:HD-GYP domain-containing protein (c-di-GMP phosphodiesterase class II)